jgi:hypothetical protein
MYQDAHPQIHGSAAVALPKLLHPVAGKLFTAPRPGFHGKD